MILKILSDCLWDTEDVRWLMRHSLVDLWIMKLIVRHTHQDRGEIFLCGHSRANCCACFRSHRCLLSPWAWCCGSACSDPRPASGFSCLLCLCSLHRPTAKTWRRSENWRSKQALCVCVRLKERDDLSKRGVKKIDCGVESKTNYCFICMLCRRTSAQARARTHTKHDTRPLDKTKKTLPQIGRTAGAKTCCFYSELLVCDFGLILLKKNADKLKELYAKFNLIDLNKCCHAQNWWHRDI